MKELPNLFIIRKNGKRYIKYGSKKFIIAEDNKTRSTKIIQRLNKMILNLQKTNKVKKKSGKKSLKLSNENPSISGGTIQKPNITEAAFSRELVKSFPTLLGYQVSQMNQKPESYKPPSVPSVPPVPPVPRAPPINVHIHNPPHSVQSQIEASSPTDNNYSDEEANENTGGPSHSPNVEILPAQGYSSAGNKVGRKKNSEKALHELEKSLKSAIVTRDAFLLNDSGKPKIGSGLKKAKDSSDYKRAATAVNNLEKRISDKKIEINKLESEIEQEGSGKTGLGLSNIDITKAMKKQPGFIGVFSIDQLGNIPVKTGEYSSFSFILNSEKFPETGHWIAIRIDPETLEYYDCFGEQPSKEFIGWAKKYFNKGLVQFKINSVKRQRINSDRCGFHAMLFLKNRNKGMSFIKASGYKIQHDSKTGESQAIKSEKHVKDFGYI